MRDAPRPAPARHLHERPGVTSLRVKTDDLGDTVVNSTSTPSALDGGAGDDQLTGGSGADTLTGNLGDDTLNGGGGSNDTASYAEAASSVDVDLATAGSQNTGGAGSDTLDSAENLTGSPRGDILKGDGGTTPSRAGRATTR